VDAQVVYVLMEVRQETDYVLHHAQKSWPFCRHARLCAPAARRPPRALCGAGDASNRQSIPGNLQALAAHYGARSVQWQQPDEWRLDAQLQAWASSQPLAWDMVDSEHFLTARGELAALMQGRRQWLMEHFYRHMRRRHRLLLDADGQPEGGQWNFDHDNRKPWPGTPPSRPTGAPHDHSALWAMLQRCGVQSLGEPQADALRWPLNRAEALACLDAFITQALPHFGDYEDAMASQAPRLFHSLLSFALNVKMLHPLEVVQRAEAAWRGGQARWLPWKALCARSWAGANTCAASTGHACRATRAQRAGPPPAAAALVLDGRDACAACSCPSPVAADRACPPHPAADGDRQFRAAGRAGSGALHRWYLGIYIDAFEWVELPNTLGMSQRADGGLIATKPYVSSAAYLQRMGDYCQGCAYDPSKTGPRACPFNALYWDFLPPRTAGQQPPAGAGVPPVAEDAPQQQEALRAQAQQLRGRLDAL
jgi:deoxyribodipyrimidine photolyase-related protein